MDGKQKLKQDVAVLEAMASEMAEYLMSDVLFWQMVASGMPKLTLGGYLMRHYRLLTLPGLLDEGDWQRVETAVFQFNHALEERIVRFEQKAHQELEARIRQWGEYLRDLDQDKGAAVNYGTAVETRVMIEALTDKLQMAPYRLQERIVSQVKLLDGNLNRRWHTGDFVWPADWQPAYPKQPFWWLYGGVGRG